MPISAPEGRQASGLHPDFAALVPDLERRLVDGHAVDDVLQLLEDTRAVAPAQASDLASHVGYLLDRLDADGLRRWILTGLRLHPDDPERLGRYFRLVDPAAAESIAAEANGVSFERSRKSLQFYAAGFGRGELQLAARRQRRLNAPALRPVIGDRELLMPDHYLAWDGALRGDIYRAAVAHALAHLRHSPRHQKANKRKPLLLAILSLIEDARVERLAAREFPGLRRLWGRFHTASGARGELTFESLTARLARALHDPAYEDPNHWVNKGRDLFEAQCGRLDDPAAFVEVGNILGNDMGQMRVRFVAERHVVEPAYRDDNSFLWEYDSDAADTPPEESLSRQSVRLEPVDAGADVALHVSPIEVETGVRWEYPEWDYRAERLRDGWVTVIDRSDRTVRAAAGGQGTPERVRGIRLDARVRMLDRAVRLRRQQEGEALDLDAVIEGRICQRARIVPDPRIFQRPGKRRRHASILLLLDLSESTNDRVTGFTSVLDIEKRAANLVAGAIDPEFDRFAIDGFCSDGRSRVHYTRIKDFDEPFGPDRQDALMRQQGAMSTRMGAALRHAGARLAGEWTEKRILLLVTDGEPSDVDVRDREYLIQDAGHAVGALHAQGVTVFCLTLDARADSYVRAIFGQRNFLIVENPVHLPMQAARVMTMVAAR